MFRYILGALIKIILQNKSEFDRIVFLFVVIQYKKYLYTQR